jgi:hypothetical protein
MSIKLNWDGMGILTSLACAIHCAFLPLIVPSLPLFGVNIIHNNAFEWAMIALAVLVGIYSLYHGYIRHHHQKFPMVLFSVGIIFLVLKQLLVTYQIHLLMNNRYEEYLLLLTAVSFIIFSHYRNYRLSKQTKCHSAHHAH